MKRTNRMQSAIKNISLALTGAALMLGLALLPAKTARAEKPSIVPEGITYYNDFSYFEDREGQADKGTLYLFGAIQNDDGIVMPKNENTNDSLTKDSVLYIKTLDSNTVLPDDCRYLFEKFENVKEIDLSNADATGVENMRYMFSECSAEKITFGDNWNTKWLNTTAYMFYMCKDIQSLDLSKFNTQYVTEMKCMFAYCYAEEIKFGPNFITNSVTDMESMFESCDVRELDLSTFDTSKVTTMKFMFYDCSAKLLDLSTFDTHNVTNMSGMFWQPFSPYVEKIIVTPGKWDTSKVTNSDDMFRGCSDLVGGKGTVYNSNYMDKTYARVDSPDTNEPGYLTSNYTPMANMSAGTDEFSLNIYLPMIDNSVSNMSVKFGSMEYQTIPEEKTVIVDNKMYLPVTLTSVAKEMTLTKPLKVFYKNAVIFDENVSVADYLKKIIEVYPETDNAYHIGAGEMLRYGGAAQVYFNYLYDGNAEKLANYGVEGYGPDTFGQIPDISYTGTFNVDNINNTFSGTTVDGATYGGMNIIYGSDFTFMVAFKVPDGVDSYAKWENKSNLDQLVASKELINDPTKYSFESDLTKKYLVVYAKNVGIKNLDQELFGFGNTKLSIPLYLSQAVNSTKPAVTDNYKTLCKALYAYHLAAKSL